MASNAQVLHAGPMTNAINIKPENIEKEATYVKKLVFSAKNGHWEEVRRILGTPRKPARAYLINCIPEDRRWSVLHQAVWHNDADIITELLGYRGCDKTVQTKSGATEFNGFETPEVLATSYGYKRVESILKTHQTSVFDVQSPTFVTGDTSWAYRVNGPPLMMLTLASYKETFHPTEIKKGTTFVQMLKTIYQFIDSETHWKKAKEKMKESFHNLDKDERDNLVFSDSKGDFYKRVLQIYTTEEFNIYSHTNKCLRKQGSPYYTPSARDLSFGPYSVILQAILLFGNCEKLTRKTYRGVLMSQSDFDKYKVGMVFSWLSFASSSTIEIVSAAFPVTTLATGDTTVKFIIDNSTSCIWQPRSIDDLSDHPGEKEGLYPAGTTFKVLSKTQNPPEIKLKLVDQD